LDFGTGLGRPLWSEGKLTLDSERFVVDGSSIALFRDEKAFFARDFNEAA
jgi:hypothetical protein